MLKAGNYPISRELLLDLTQLRAPFGRLNTSGEPAQAITHEWELISLSDASRTGYDGALFSTHIQGRPTYVIFHQGSNDRRDFPTLVRLANQKIPQQLEDAENFTAQSMGFIWKKHPDGAADILHVGYSLGGALSMLVSHKDQPVIAFESPGIRNLIEKLGRDPDKIGTRVLEVLSPLSNLVNAHGYHIGQVLAPGERDWQASKCSIGNFVDLTVKSHQLSDIQARIASEPVLESVPAENTNRSDTVFGAFLEYLHDCRDQNPGLQVKIFEAATRFLVATHLDQLATTAVLTFGEYFPDTLAKWVFGPVEKEHAAERAPAHAPSKEPDLVKTIEAHHPRFQQRLAAERATPPSGIGHS